MRRLIIFTCLALLPACQPAVPEVRIPPSPHGSAGNVKEYKTTQRRESQYLVGSKEMFLGNLPVEASQAYLPEPLGEWNFGTPGKVSVLALPEQQDVPFGKEHRGLRFLVVNRSPEKVKLPTLERGLDLVVEARDAVGKWRPIEYPFRDPKCGTNNYAVVLGPDEYWDLVAPRYAGPRPTRLRLRLNSTPPALSNEFIGSIHPRQFDEEKSSGRTSR